jgi:MSHA pilin protein MshA
VSYRGFAYKEHVMKAKQQGFTLVELVVVLVVLGILAAVAIPKYVSYTSEARTAAMNGLAGAVRSSVMLVQSRYVAVGNTTATTVTLADGTTVTTTAGANGGIPVLAAGGIDAAVNQTGFTYTAATGRYDFSSGVVANCFLTYAATGVATVTSTGC